MPALALAAALAVSLTAGHAAPRSIMQDDTLLLRSGPAVRDQALDEMRALGVDTVRVVPIWRDHAAAPLALRRPREPYPPAPSPRSTACSRPRAPAASTCC